MFSAALPLHDGAYGNTFITQFSFLNTFVIFSCIYLQQGGGSK